MAPHTSKISKQYIDTGLLIYEGITKSLNNNIFCIKPFVQFRINEFNQSSVASTMFTLGFFKSAFSNYPIVGFNLQNQVDVYKLKRLFQMFKSKFKDTNQLVEKFSYRYFEGDVTRIVTSAIILSYSGSPNNQFSIKISLIDPNTSEILKSDEVLVYDTEFFSLHDTVIELQRTRILTSIDAVLHKMFTKASVESISEKLDHLNVTQHQASISPAIPVDEHIEEDLDEDLPDFSDIHISQETNDSQSIIPTEVFKNLNSSNTKNNIPEDDTPPWDPPIQQSQEKALEDKSTIAQLLSKDNP